MKFLTDLQHSELRARHKLERDRRICDRIKAVLLYDKGWTYEEIAEALLLSEGAIKNHIKDYQAESKLIPDGGGSNEKLSEKLKAGLPVNETICFTDGVHQLIMYNLHTAGCQAPSVALDYTGKV